MKKLLLTAALLLSVPLFSLAQNQKESAEDQQTQITIPREVYIGDEGIIQYSFRSPFDLFPGNSDHEDTPRQNEDSISVPLDEDILLEVAGSCSITNATLFRNGVNYTLSISFIPWRIGEIKFKQFDLAAYTSPENFQNQDKELQFPVKLHSISISSITDKIGTKNLRPPKPPLLVPGTNYIILGLIILILMFILMLFITAVKLPEILKLISTLREKLGFYKNAQRTVKKLHRLGKKYPDDKAFAENWQHIMRSYLDYRFSTSFAAITATRIHAKIFELIGGMSDEMTDDALEDLNSLFTRTNYIRFAQGSIDSQLLPVEEHQAVFAEGEKREMVKTTESIIEVLERRI